MKLYINRLPLLAVIFINGGPKKNICNAVYDCRICKYYSSRVKRCMATRQNIHGQGINLDGFLLNPENRRGSGLINSICNSYKPERRVRLI